LAFFVYACGIAVVLVGVAVLLPPSFRWLFYLVSCGILAFTLIPLLVSFYIYDASGLYRFDWIVANPSIPKIVNIHAGFDETSALLQQKFPQAKLEVFDFYNPSVHTEPSIARARKYAPLYPGTQSISTHHIPVETGEADLVFIIFAAHEIRDNRERIAFFKEIKRITKQGGEIYVLEHLRDLPNFLAYNIGFLHFMGRKIWLNSFLKSELFLEKETAINPFVRLFKLKHP